MKYFYKKCIAYFKLITFRKSFEMRDSKFLCVNPTLIILIPKNWILLCLWKYIFRLVLITILIITGLILIIIMITTPMFTKLNLLLIKHEKVNVNKKFKNDIWIITIFYRKKRVLIEHLHCAIQYIINYIFKASRYNYSSLLILLFENV